MFLRVWRCLFATSLLVKALWVQESIAIIQDINKAYKKNPETTSATYFSIFNSTRFLFLLNFASFL